MNITFRAIEKEDLLQLKVWRNEITDVCREYRLISTYHQERWYQEYCEQLYQPHPKHIMFAITSSDNILLGVCGVCYIDWLNRKAEVSIYIGNTSERGKGYGLQTLQELHRVAFDEYSLHTLYAEIHDWNKPSISLFEKAGYKLVGKIRESRIKEGKYYPTWLYDITEGDYRQQ